MEEEKQGSENCKLLKVIWGPETKKQYEQGLSISTETKIADHCLFCTSVQADLDEWGIMWQKSMIQKNVARGLTISNIIMYLGILMNELSLYFITFVEYNLIIIISKINAWIFSKCSNCARNTCCRLSH